MNPFINIRKIRDNIAVSGKKYLYITHNRFYFYLYAKPSLQAVL